MSQPQPPLAAVRPHRVTIHGDSWVDPYFWLRDKKDPQVIAHLEAENAYTHAMLDHTKGLQDALYQEMLGRIKEDDTTVPAPRGEYLYYSRTEAQKAYRINCRRKRNGPEEILLDANKLAEGQKYTVVGTFAVSPDHRFLAYSVDHAGSERYTLFIKDLETGKLLPEQIKDTYYSVAWASDNKTIYYNTINEASRPYRLYRHTLGSDPAQDELVYQEDNAHFNLSAQRTRSGAYLLMTLHSAVTTEVHAIDASVGNAKPQLIHPRQQGMEYYVEHHGDVFYIRTNDGATNFKLVKVATSAPQKANWVEVIAHRDDQMLADVDAFRSHLVLSVREQGLPKLIIKPLTGGEPHAIAFDEQAYDVYLTSNLEFDSATLRFSYTSLTTPESVFDYQMDHKTRVLRKVDPVLGYDKTVYRTERLMARAKDGTQIPISLVSHKDTPRDGSAPMLLNGYGSYGYSFDANFNANWISLLDRGFIVGIAHIRGGGEMGRAWKEAGKFAHKVNTFTDFIACAEHLIAEKYTSPSKLAIAGRSAGGLLIGAVLNMRPDLFGAAIAGVPFVDVLNTMLDDTIPLTVIEWEEWGNPNTRPAYDWIKAYSPYNNVKAQAYPHLLVTAGLNDPRVGFWEPAKWVAKLRTHKTDDHWLLLKTHMGAGHGGESGRYGKLRDRALEFAFLVDRLGR
ncbi:MAG: S9 family peptidase [Deltaproteobacteria bacterium]|nr:S9 family peptidase [Deltaproteobacteria bacterium]